MLTCKVECVCDLWIVTICKDDDAILVVRLPSELESNTAEIVWARASDKGKLNAVKLIAARAVQVANQL